MFGTVWQRMRMRLLHVYGCFPIRGHTVGKLQHLCAWGMVSESAIQEQQYIVSLYNDGWCHSIQIVFFFPGWAVEAYAGVSREANQGPYHSSTTRRHIKQQQYETVHNWTGSDDSMTSCKCPNDSNVSINSVRILPKAHWCGSLLDSSVQTVVLDWSLCFEKTTAAWWTSTLAVAREDVSSTQTGCVLRFMWSTIGFVNAMIFLVWP
jgi:hypothetical protein